MKTKETQIKDKNGRMLTLRSAENCDAGNLIAFLKTVFDASPYLYRTADEFKVTEAEEQVFIQKAADAPRTELLLILNGNEVLACADIRMENGCARLAHRASFGISVLPSAQGVGLGTIMLERIQDAKDAGFEQLELDCVSENVKAIGLYQKFGFYLVGTIPRGAKMDSIHYYDYNLMVKTL